MVPVHTERLKKEPVCLWLWSVRYLPAGQPAPQHPGRAGGLSLQYLSFSVDVSLLMTGSHPQPGGFGPLVTSSGDFTAQEQCRPLTCSCLPHLFCSLKQEHFSPLTPYSA